MTKAKMPSVKRSRSLSIPAGKRLKRRKAMTRERAEEMLTNEVATSMLIPSRLPRIVPPKLRTKLRYQINVSLDPASGGLAANLYRANDGYDPDFSGVGAQPKGLDQFFAFYGKGLCKGSKITIKAVNATSGQSCQWGVSLRTSTTTELAPRGYVEDPHAVWALGANVSTVNQECTLAYSPWKTFGAKGDLKDDDELHFTSSASPTKTAYYHVWLAAYGSFDVAAHSILGVIEYDFEFFEPKDVGPS